jgi:hypothetical protein
LPDDNDARLMALPTDIRQCARRRGRTDFSGRDIRVRPPAGSLILPKFAPSGTTLSIPTVSLYHVSLNFYVR